MDAEAFEDRLMDLIAEAQDAGLHMDAIISALELRVMALNEEQGEG